MLEIAKALKALRLLSKRSLSPYGTGLARENPGRTDVMKERGLFNPLPGSIPIHPIESESFPLSQKEWNQAANVKFVLKLKENDSFKVHPFLKKGLRGAN